MNLYVLFYFAEQFHGVFSSKDKAKDYAKKYCEGLEISFNFDDWDVLETTLDKYL